MRFGKTTGTRSEKLPLGEIARIAIKQRLRLIMDLWRRARGENRKPKIHLSIQKNGKKKTVWEHSED